ncbi:MAG: fused response regulator/phosphatase [Victivallales bacterium]|nr:fused response regulator/phosphatase [Victivallales bacterium]
MNNEAVKISFEAHKDRPVTVLLIDDQPMVGEAVRRMLEKEDDIVFHYCRDPGMAIATAVKTAPTVILQDLIMPDIDGLTLVKYFRAEPATRNIPLIVLSSEENARVKADAFAFGANDYLIKLPDRVELLARIRYHSRGYIHMLERNDAFEAIVRTQKALAAELAEAADYVQSLLPPRLTGAITVDWQFIPSTSLGGDGFGYHWLDDEHFAFFLLDVAGHGVGAALLSVSVVEALRTRTLAQTDFGNPADVLLHLNRTFKMQEHNHKFFTIWYGVFNRTTRELIFASGGHPPAVLVHGNSCRDAATVLLKTSGAMIGALEEIEFQNQTVTLMPFNRLFVFSDGAFEIVNDDDQMWEFDDFIALLTTPENGDLPTVEAVHDRIAELKGGRFDDDFSLLRLIF